jgi:hypothetical protein
MSRSRRNKPPGLYRACYFRFFTSCILCGLLTSCASSPELSSPPAPGPLTLRQQNILNYFRDEDRFMRSSPNQVISDSIWARAYPSKVAISFFSVFDVSRDPTYLEDAVRQVEWGHSQETPNDLIRQPPGAPGTDGGAPSLFSSFGLSSSALGYELAFKSTRDPRYVQWADDTISALLALPTTVGCWQGRCFNLFYLLYLLDPPFSPYGTVDLEPAQVATHGVALISEIAHAQLDAALIMMDSNGRIPLTSHPSHVNQFDTAYGSVTLLWVTWANRYWKDQRYDQALELGAKWLNEYTHGGARTLRYYPTSHTGPVPDPQELYYRLPLFYFYGGDLETLGTALDDIWMQWPNFEANVRGGYVSPFIIFKDMGIPASEYWR